MRKTRYGFNIEPGTHVQFDYENWRGERHTYIVAVEGFEWGEFASSGKSGTHMVMHGYVAYRDGKARPGVHPRRTFVVEKLENMAAYLPPNPHT